MEFIKTEQPRFLGDTRGDRHQRVSLTGMLTQFGMNLVHEGVEVNALLALVRYRGKEAVHDEAFASTNAAPEIYPLGDARRFEHALERAAAIRLEANQGIVELLQPLDGVHLCRVRLKTLGFKCCRIGAKHAGSVGVECGHVHTNILSCFGGFPAGISYPRVFTHNRRVVF